MPVWLTLILVAATALGTYKITPKINKEIQLENSRTQHISETIKLFNENTIELLAFTRKFNNSLFYRRRSLEADRALVLDQITKMQWRLIDVGVVFSGDAESTRQIRALKLLLGDLGNAVSTARLPADQERVLEAAEGVTIYSRRMIAALYSVAGLTDESRTAVFAGKSYLIDTGSR